MQERSFMIQRYASANWPQLQGRRPFIATGPNFRLHTTTQTIHHEWKFKQSMRDLLTELGDSTDRLSREIAAETLLREGICSALWLDGQPTGVPIADRMKASIDQLADEISIDGSLRFWITELLSGLADPSHFRNYISDDGLELTTLRIA